MTMSKLKLGTLADDKPVKVSREFPATLFRDLQLYGRLLAQPGQPPIEPEKLIVPMLERFLATDREFQKARRAAS
ncbi:conserved hypothetical protein [Hyphomicrobium sp. GJ21]|nr:conserved hypothetical protein [Hyphomicrobium sp. GJ21]